MTCIKHVSCIVTLILRHEKSLTLSRDGISQMKENYADSQLARTN